MARIERRQPQIEYDGLQKFIQQEWALLQRTTPGFREVFHPVEEALKRSFLPELFRSGMIRIPERGVNRIQVKQAGLAIPNLNL